MNGYQLFYIIVVLICILLDQRVDADCVMHDVCHQESGGAMNCPASKANGTNKARELDEADLERIRTFCPHMIDKYTSFCCSSAQIDAMASNLRTAGNLLSRCSSCNDNFQKLWCEFTCSPNQHEFVKVTEEVEAPGRNISYVNGVQYDISKDFATSLHASCKDVKMGASLAIRLMCGNLGENEVCGVKEWLQFMGTQNHKMKIPLNIKFVLHEKGANSTFMHEKTTPCHMSPRMGLDRCSRQDCAAVKTTELFQEEDMPEQCRVLTIGCTKFCLFLSIGILVSIISCVVISSIFFRSNGGNQKNVIAYKGVDEDRLGTIQTFGTWIENQLEVNTKMYGRFTARYPWLVICFGCFLIVICSSGNIFVQIVTNPIELWASPSSQFSREKHFFDTNFSPFYRVEQIIMIPKNSETVPGPDVIMGPAFQKEFMHEAFNLVSSIRRMKAVYENKNITLDDVCYRPMGPDYDCLIMSPTNYFQNSLDTFNHSVTEKIQGDDFDYYSDSDSESRDFNYLDHMFDCIKNPYNIETSTKLSCLGTYGGPIYPDVVFGLNTDLANVTAINATAIIITIPLNGRQSNTRKALAWETGLINLLLDYKHPDLQLTFMTERSIEDELTRESTSDAVIVSISCILMFFYVALALGQYTVYNDNLLSILIHTKFGVAVTGVMVIIGSVFSGTGVLGLYGLKASVIALVVLVFVVFAVSVNWIFLFVQYYQQNMAGSPLSIDDKAAEVAGSVMPSIGCAAISETLCFFCGAMTNIPAVRSFSLHAAVCIFFTILYQSTIFLAIFIRDMKREEAGKPEFLCGRMRMNVDPAEREGYVYTFVNRHLAPNLLRSKCRIVVLIFFMLCTCGSIAAIPYLEMGVDPKMSVPQDSYVYYHFKALSKYMSIGPPVFFVVEGELDVHTKEVQDMFCTIGGCREDSVGAILQQAVEHPKITRVMGEVQNWMDNMIMWMNKNSECCRVHTNDPAMFCSTNRKSDYPCRSCDPHQKNGRPTHQAFYEHISDFMNDVPNAICTKGGRAAFKDAIMFNSRGHVHASHFMTYHTPLKTSADYLAAIKGGRAVSRKIMSLFNHTVNVFPYSPFYLYYETYETIRYEASTQLIISLGAVLLVKCLLLGCNVWAAAVSTLFNCTVLIDIIGLMAWWGIEFNPISVVNLCMSVGFSVEFSIHTIKRFLMSTSPTRSERAKDAISQMGPTVFSGITMTMFIGSVVLAFSHSQIFKVYYFRLFFGIVVIGAFRGLIFLPVVLSFIGPPISHRALQLQAEKQKKEELEKAAALAAELEAAEANPTVPEPEDSTPFMDDQELTSIVVDSEDDKKATDSLMTMLTPPTSSIVRSNRFGPKGSPLLD